MGYTTWFDGYFETDERMSAELVNKINEFSEERHCNSNSYNDHTGYPGYWCNWYASSPTTIQWNGAEKFYDYESWLIYIIDKFMKPNGIVLNGEVEWNGEGKDDFGLLIVEDNVVYVRYGYISYGDKELINYQYKM